MNQRPTSAQDKSLPRRAMFVWNRNIKMSPLKKRASFGALLVLFIILPVSLFSAYSASGKHRAARRASPVVPGNITIKSGNYIGTTTTETFTFQMEVFNSSSSCSGSPDSTATHSNVNSTTGYTFALGSGQSVRLTASPGTPYAHSEQNGLFPGWQAAAGNTHLPTYLPGDGREICVEGFDGPGTREYLAQFYAGIEYFDSCGNPKTEFRPGETMQIKITGGLTFNPLPFRLLAAGGSVNECTFLPSAPAFTPVEVTSDPFIYTFTLPSSDAEILPSCASSGTQHITGQWRTVVFDGSCGCNRNDVKFQVKDDAPPPPASCSLSCPTDITVPNDPGACGAVVNYPTPPAGGSATVSCDHPSGGLFPVGTTAVTCTSTAGPSCSFNVTVNDTENPVVTSPPNIVTSTDAGACSATVNPGTATVGDNCAGATVNGIRSDAQPLNAPYPKGITTINWTATDAAGHTASASQTVTVNDTQNPVISCPANLTVDNDAGACSATLNPGTATATDNCPGVSVAGVRSDGQPLNATYPVGTTTILWTATDAVGNQSSCTQSIIVKDAEAPTITGVSVTPNELWPPNHKMVNVTVNYNVTDNCSSAPQINCVLTVSSNQPINGTGDGDTSPDWVVVDAHHVQLRAERSQGQTRIYTITITCTDAKGNTSTRTATVSVTH